MIQGLVLLFASPEWPCLADGKGVLLVQLAQFRAPEWLQGKPNCNQEIAW